jgi:DNA polymerase III subunit delta
MTRTELDRSLRENRISPLYLLVGIETYLRDSAADAITDAALNETLLREFNQTSFSLITKNAREAIAAAEQLPMMSGRRVVRISDFGKLREADEDALISYVLRPNETSVVIFVAADLDKRRKLTKALLDNSVVIDFPALSYSEAKAWLRTRLKELKTAADDQALSELLDLVGTDVQTLNSELDKLTAATIDSKRITRDTVEELTGRTRELSNFDLGDHIVARNRKRALEVLHRLLEGGTPPVMLIGLLASNYHRLALAKDVLLRGSKEDVYRLVPMPAFKRNAFMSALQQLDAKRITRDIQLIAAADLAIKTSQATPRLQLELLVCELAN